MCKKLSTDTVYNRLLRYSAEEPEAGEPWHQNYKDYKDQFEMVVTANADMEKEVYKVFQEYAKKAGDAVNWAEYEKRKAAEEDGDLLDLVAPERSKDTSTFWEEHQAELIAAMLLGIGMALSAGGQRTELESGINIGWSEVDGAAIQFINEYSFDLVKNISLVTRERMRQSLKLSIGLGESRKEAAARLASVFDNPKRAQTIADTEVVRAYTEGRILVAEATNLTVTKDWVISAGACQLCIDNSRQPGLPIRAVYAATQTVGPPGHPRCRCDLVFNYK